MNEKNEQYFNVVPCHLTAEKQETHVNLLFLEDRYYVQGEPVDNQPSNFHYVWIKNLSALVATERSTHRKKIFVCERCLHFFYYEYKFRKHEPECARGNKCKISLPPRNLNTLKFVKHMNREKVPFVVYADIESLLKPVLNNDKVLQKHVAYSIGYCVQCNFNEDLCGYYKYRQENQTDESPAEWFVKSLYERALEYDAIFGNKKLMNDLTEKEAEEFAKATICHIRRKSLGDEKPVRDHCHLTGR